MKNIKQKENNLWYRLQFLELVKFCWIKYSQTKDSFYKEKANFFSSQVKQYDENGEFKEVI